MIGHTARVGQRAAGPGGPDGRLGVRGNLPAEISSFVGRAGDLARCADLLRQGRLLTLTGAGGAGKTRLALRLAGTLAAGFPGGVWWVDLAPLTGPEAVTGAVARAVPAVPAGAGLDIMAEVLAEAGALLVLDNCEHLGAGVSELVDRLLRGTRAVRVLATSRGVLEVEGEIVWRVHPLAVPPARAREAELRRYDAARLFLERAGQARPDVRPQAADVVAVCRQLDGLPLALELAAARFRAATMTQILAGLDDRFALLTRTGGAAPSRQRTLLASVQWSHDLLAAPAQVLLRRLAVFAGGWTLEAAREVTGFIPLEPDQVPGLLAGLVDASMVQLEDAAGAGRYRLLETIRAYAADRLADAGETADLADRHLEWAAGLAQSLEAGTAAADPAALARLDAEVANLRAALDHAAGAAPAGHAGLRLVAALGFFWVHRGYALAGDDRTRRSHRGRPGCPGLVARPGGAGPRLHLLLRCRLRSGYRQCPGRAGAGRGGTAGRHRPCRAQDGRPGAPAARRDKPRRRPGRQPGTPDRCASRGSPGRGHLGRDRDLADLRPQSPRPASPGGRPPLPEPVPAPGAGS